MALRMQKSHERDGWNSHCKVLRDQSILFFNKVIFSVFLTEDLEVQVFVGEDEPADSVVRRFRKAVMQAGVIPECRRRRFHETPQDIVKRKQQNARRRKTRFVILSPRCVFAQRQVLSSEHSVVVYSMIEDCNMNFCDVCSALSDETYY